MLHRGGHSRVHVLKDQVRRVHQRVSHDVEVVAQEEEEEDGLDDRGDGDVRDELVGFYHPNQGPLAVGFGGEGAKLADRVNEEAGVDGGGDGEVGKGNGEGAGDAEADDAGGDGANKVAEAGYVVFVLLFGDGSVS